MSHHNADFTLHYRGQTDEFTAQGNSTSLLPTIYRKPEGEKLRREELVRRFERLSRASELLTYSFKRRRIRGHRKLRNFPEIAWAILQHYQVCPTPALDLTSSLRVAASLALREANERGYVYVLGLPYMTDSISYYVEDEIVHLRLLSICPPSALRPYFQEGSLVASYPTVRDLGGLNQMDVGRRLVAKYRVGGPNFWDADFPSLPQKALFPTGDQVAAICDSVQEEI